MTYYEAYQKQPTIEAIKAMAIRDTKVALSLFGGDKGRLKAIEDAMNKAIHEKERMEVEHGSQDDRMHSK